MPRRRLTEYKAKQLVNQALGLDYLGWPLTGDEPLNDQLKRIEAEAGPFIVKVDQGIKGRFKKGLVKLDVSKAGLKVAVEELSSKGFTQFIVEPMVKHPSNQERYLNLSLTRNGTILQFTPHGGIDVEQHGQAMERVNLDEGKVDWRKICEDTGIPVEIIKDLTNIFAEQFMSFLEINPYIVQNGQPTWLDMAVEVDDAGGYFVNEWDEDDLVSAEAKTEEEATIEALAAKSPASFKLSVLNPDGRIFLLLSGGGASIVVADQAFRQKSGELLANYGEYSGNPNTEETYIYTRAVLSLLLKSQAPKKVLFIGGAVANFTDIANTFTGIIQALTEQAEELRRQRVKVFVRRGGPRQEIGLPLMTTKLDEMGLLGAVHGPEVGLAEAVNEAVEEVA